MNTIELQLKIPMHGFFLNSTKLNLPAIRMMIGQSGWFLPILAWFLLTLCHVDADDCGCVDNATLEPASAGIVSGADDDDCPLVRVVSAQHATVIRARPQLKPGPLFYGSGSFAEKEVGEACDPGQSFGPFDVVAGGKLRARLSGEPAVQQRWSLFNRGTGVRITFEPNLGAGNYGPAQEVVVFYIPADETNAEMEGTWSGPGRLTAVTFSPARADQRGGGKAVGGGGTEYVQGERAPPVQVR
ncbi:MAG TPA: hypothetical protein PKD64_07670 [Pirellulaceae bacterium]|nr:hypothetical protein [Pirellulaceae bacterium]